MHFSTLTNAAEIMAL